MGEKVATGKGSLRAMDNGAGKESPGEVSRITTVARIRAPQRLSSPRMVKYKEVER
jgi:hypothetical protein